MTPTLEATLIRRLHIRDQLVLIKIAEDGPNELTFRTSLIEEAQYDFRVCTLTLDMFQRQNASYS